MQVNQLLVKELEQSQSKQRASLIKQLAALRYLLRQGLSIRNDHSGGSNLTVLLETVLEENSWVSDKKYQSPEIINEMIEIMAHKVLRSLLSEISCRSWFSLLADETRDTSNREQLVLCVRSVSDHYEIFEDQIGLIQLENTTADTIYSSLKDGLLRLGIPFDKCRGQAYDGARNFQGHINGVAKKFHDDNVAAISVHCLAHCVNLCLQEIAVSSQPVKEALSFSMEIIQLIKYSPKRQVTFEGIQKQQDYPSSSGIRTLCPTRWTVRTGAMQAIITNYEALRETMEAASQGTDDCSRRANGMLALMDRFSTFFGLKFSILLFSITEQMLIHLQNKDTTVEDGYHIVAMCIKAIERLRTDCSFKDFFDSVKEEASGKCDEPILPRYRRLPRRIDDGSTPEHRYSSVEEYYRKEYFQAIDTIKGDLENRFMQGSFLFVRKIESLLIDSANGKGVSIPKEVSDLYGNDIDFRKLELHLQMLPDAVRATPLDGIYVREVTRVQTICDIFNQQSSIKALLSEVHKLISIYLTIPVTTATAERSFSALKRIKTYLRNSMTQQRLNHCFILHVHRQKTDSLDLPEIAEEFIQRNERKQAFFGKFN